MVSKTTFLLKGLHNHYLPSDIYNSSLVSAMGSKGKSASDLATTKSKKFRVWSSGSSVVLDKPATWFWWSDGVPLHLSFSLWLWWTIPLFPCLLSWEMIGFNMGLWKEVLWSVGSCISQVGVVKIVLPDTILYHFTPKPRPITTSGLSFQPKTSWWDIIEQ